MVLLLSGCAVVNYNYGDGSYGRIALKREVAGCWHVVFGYVDVIVALVNLRIIEAWCIL